MTSPSYILFQALGLDPQKDKRIALVGAGGKTTLLFALAREANAAGRHTALLTTTHIGRPKPAADLALLSASATEEEIHSAWQKRQIALCGADTAEGKLRQPEAAVLRLLLTQAETLVMEADGSKRLPIKIPAAWEPVILPETDRVIVVAGLSALGQPLSAACHRPQLAAETLGVEIDAIINEAMVARLLFEGYARFSPLFLLNQADTPLLTQRGAEIAALLQAQGSSARVLSLRHLLEETDARSL